jgi:chromosome segregation ATPase
LSRIGIQDLAALAGIEGLTARRAMAPFLARRAALEGQRALCRQGLAAAPTTADDLGLAARALAEDRHRSALRARLGEIATELAEVERALQPLRAALQRAEARSDVLEQLAADLARKDARRRARRAEEG